MLTLEMCKRLKDAGFRQDTKLIYWKGDDDALTEYWLEVQG